MKSIIVTITPFILAITFFACGSVWDEQVSADTVNEILPLIQSNDTLSDGKKKYIADMIPMSAGLASLASLAGKPKGIPTYRDLFIDFSRQYDSTAAVYRSIRENNENLRQLVKLASVKSLIFSEYSSMIGLDITINNAFGKDLLYMILEYELVDKYDTRYFSHRVKLTDELIEDNRANVSVFHKYDQVSRYLWSKAPSNDEKRQAFFDENFRLRVLSVVFTDKTEVSEQSAEWEYL